MSKLPERHLSRPSGPFDTALVSADANACDSEAVFHSCPVDPSCPYCNGSISRLSGNVFDWSFLEGVYCISLRSRNDRADSAAAQFHRIGLCRRVLFYRPTRHPKSAKKGIWQSHRTVAIHAHARGCSRTLIMEDDVLFLRNLSAGKLQSVSKALDTLPPDWMIFYLGHWPLWAYFVGPEVLRTGSVCAHAYIASPGLLTWLKDHPYESPDIKKAPRIVGNGIDAAYARLAQTYAFFPMIAIQSKSKSDNLPIEPAKKKRKFRHLIRRSKYRELLLSSLMRPAEFFTAALSPVFYAFRHALDRYSRWH